MLHELLGPEWGRQQLATAGLWHSRPRSFWSQHCISSLTTRPHSSCFPARAHCRLKDLSVLFPSSALSLHSFLLFSFFLALSLPIQVPFPVTLALCLCVPCTSKARTWYWQQETSVPHGESPILFHFLLSQTRGHLHNVSHVIVLKFVLHEYLNVWLEFCRKCVSILFTL